MKYYKSPQGTYSVIFTLPSLQCQQPEDVHIWKIYVAQTDLKL